MRIFTHEEMNHQDIDRAFNAYQPRNKKTTKPISKPVTKPATQLACGPDNFLIIIILVLIILEMREK